jgi:hypothetical protein
MLAKIPPAPPSAPDSALAIGPRMKRPGRQLGQIGDHRRDQIAEVELAGLHELAHRVLGRGEGPDQRLADITADVARLGGIVGERRSHRAPAGRGLVSPCGSFSPGVARGCARTSGSGCGVVQFGVQGIRRTGGICQRRFGLRSGAGHRVAQRLPTGQRTAGSIGQHACRLAIAVGPATRIVCHRAKPEVGRLEVGLRQRGREGIAAAAPAAVAAPSNGLPIRASSTGSSVPIRTPPSPTAQSGSRSRRRSAR